MVTRIFTPTCLLDSTHLNLPQIETSCVQYKVSSTVDITKGRELSPAPRD